MPSVLPYPLPSKPQPHASVYEIVTSRILAEAIITAMPNPPAFEQDSQAAYGPSRDTVTMPSRTAFESQAEQAN
jgi:hypothetical protein